CCSWLHLHVLRPLPAPVRTVAVCGRPADRPCALPSVGPVPVAERIAVVGPALLGRCGVAVRVAWGGLRGGRLAGDEGKDGEGGDQGLHGDLSFMGISPSSEAGVTALVWGPPGLCYRPTCGTDW